MPSPALPAADPAMSGSSNVAAMKKVVQQLRLEASVTRVKVSAEPGPDGTGRPRRHFTAPGPRPPRWGRAGAPTCPALPCPPTRLGGGARASPGAPSGSVGRGEPGKAAQPCPPRRHPGPGLGRSLAPLGPGRSRPRRSPGARARPALPDRARGEERSPSGSGDRPPPPGPQQAVPAPARQDGDVAARHTDCSELVRAGAGPRLARRRSWATGRYSVSAKCNFFKL